jgi:hypothetical protein
MNTAYGRSRDNWIVREAARADAREDRIVLENPNTVASLDAKLRNTFFPFIHAELEKTGFRYLPMKDDLHIDSQWSGPNFARALSIMLFDDFDRFFTRCTLQCSNSGYLVEREFHLGLPETTDPRFLFRILGEPRFSGNMPSLTIQRSMIHPEWNSYFWIEIRAGSGIDWSSWTMDKAAMGDIAQTINDSCHMYNESMVEGFASMEDVERFLEIACRSYESG